MLSKLRSLVLLISCAACGVGVIGGPAPEQPGLDVTVIDPHGTDQPGDSSNDPGGDSNPGDSSDPGDSTDPGDPSSDPGDPSDPSDPGDQTPPDPIENMVTIQSGTFTMGSPESEPAREDNETQHQVTLTRSFAIGATEVTQAEFVALMGWNPSAVDNCNDCPVERVSWYDAVAYANELSRHQGGTPCYDIAHTFCVDGSYPNADYMACMNSTAGGISFAEVAVTGASSVYACTGYRLPTEAEWEYAARAGTTTGTYNGTVPEGSTLCEEPNAVIDSIAWFCGNTGWGTEKAATRAPNPWQLYDMLGNVWEWCHDAYSAALDRSVDPTGGTGSAPRVYRGGCCYGYAKHARAAYRARGEPDYRYDGLGFRIVRSF